MDDLQLVRLLHLCDPNLPIGGFSHSAGLETYVQQGRVHDKATAQAFIQNQLQYNLRYTDAALASLAFDVALAGNSERIAALDAECHALKLPREMREASQKMGLRLVKMLLPLVASDCANAYWQQVRSGACQGHYCIAFGLFSAAMGIEKKAALGGFYYNAAVGMVTNSVKLVPLGQQDGQALLFALHPLLAQLAEATLHPDPEMTGLCCAAFDIGSMQHEVLYSRLYMS